VNVHASVPVPEAVSQEGYKSARTYHARVTRARDSFNRLLAVVAIGATVIAVALGVALAAVFPLQRTVPFLVVINQETDTITYPKAGIEDADKYITPRMIHSAVVAYVEAREGYVPQTDEMQFNRVRDSSTLDVFNVYEAWTKSRSGPKQQPNTTIKVDHFVTAEPVTSTNGTQTFPEIRFNRRVTADGVQAAMQICKGALSLRLMPKMMLPSEADVDLNPIGMLVVAYEEPKCHFEGEKG
jgi:type IV secretory pathway component VirB8